MVSTKSKRKVSTFEFGTTERSPKEISYVISNELFHSLEQSHIKEIKTDDKRFLDLIQTNEIPDTENIKLSFELNNDMISMKNISKEDYLVRLMIAHKIAKDDVLNTSTFKYVSLNPNALFFEPLKEVFYSYRANEAMPHYTEDTKMKRYKALILYILTGYSYEKGLASFENIKKSKSSDLVKAIINAISIEEIQELLNSAVNSVQYKKIKNEQKRNINRKRNIIYTIIGAIILFGIVLLILNNKAQEQNKELKSKYEHKLEQQEVKNDISMAKEKGDTEKVAKLMKENNYPKKEQLKFYKENHMYQDELNIDPTKLEDVIKEMYSNKKQDKLVDINIKKGDLNKEKYSDLKNKLEMEQDIVAGNLDDVMNEVAFIEDKNTARRLGNALLKDKRIQEAESIGKQFNDDYIKNRASQIDKEDKLKKEEEKLDNLNKSKKKDKKKIKLQEEKIKDLKSEIEGLKKETEEGE
ncbi:TPA: hypothetical protein O6N71_002712 [Staphylococcus aureus]|nr:hypothetical protein [Staphylococcus aureus]HDB3402384.1 hypothetical protein [Staphylococcus aureus]